MLPIFPVCYKLNVGEEKYDVSEIERKAAKYHGLDWDGLPVRDRRDIRELSKGIVENPASADDKGRLIEKVRRRLRDFFNGSEVLNTDVDLDAVKNEMRAKGKLRAAEALEQKARDRVLGKKGD